MARFLDLKQKNGRRQNLVKPFLKITRFKTVTLSTSSRKQILLREYEHTGKKE